MITTPDLCDIFRTSHLQGPVDSISWALDNSALLVVQGSSIYSIDVQESLSSLEHLCRRYLTDEALAGCSAQAMLMLPLPVREIKTLSRMTSQLIPVSGTPHSHEIYSFYVQH